MTPPKSADKPQPHETPRSAGSDAAGPLVVLLCSEDAALRAAWAAAPAPEWFRLAAADRPDPSRVAAEAPALVVLDAADADADDVRRVEAAGPERCVWAGTAETLEAMEPERVAAAYDVLARPTSPRVLGRRVAEWARNVERAASLEELGRRVEALAEANERLSAELAEVTERAEVIDTHRERLDVALGRIRQVAALSREINSLDLDVIVRVSVEKLPKIVQARRASLYLYDAIDNRLVLQGHSPDRKIAERVDLKANPNSPMAAAVRRGELMLICAFGEYERAEDLVLDRAYEEQYETGSCIIVPLKGGAGVRGVLNLADKEGGGEFDADIDLPVVEQIAELIGASIYNVELYQEMERRAKTDPLTELANRRALEDALARETDRSRRYGSPLSVLMFDVDGLKAINDKYGHDVGDAVLTHMAGVLDDTVRSVDVPGRWAGDEYVVVLPDTTGGQARRLAKRLLKGIHTEPPQAGGKELPISISVGVAEYEPDESTMDLVRRADQAMYEAKKSGRDRVEMAR